MCLSSVHQSQVRGKCPKAPEVQEELGELGQKDTLSLRAPRERLPCDGLLLGVPAGRTANSIQQPRFCRLIKLIKKN